MAVQSGSSYSTPTAYWRTASTVVSARLGVTPYHVHVPSFGDWGFVLAQAGGVPPELRLSPNAPPLRFLDGEVLRSAAVFPGTAARSNWPRRPSTTHGSCRTCGRATSGRELGWARRLGGRWRSASSSALNVAA